MHIYRRIKTELASLKDATNLTVSLRSETVKFCGLNSPYVSHQKCEVEFGHRQPELAIFSNSKAWLAATPCYCEEKFTGDVAVRRLPSHFLRELFKFPASAPAWIDSDQLVSVAVKAGFSGFDDSGKPKFRTNISGKFDGHTLFSEHDRQIVFMYDHNVWEWSEEQSALYVNGEKIVKGSELPLTVLEKYKKTPEPIDVALADFGLILQCTHDCPHEFHDSCQGCPHDTSMSLNFIEANDE